MMIFGSLFSGIGGFDIGLERAGMQCAWQVEIDPHCQKLLGDKFPHAKRFTDVRNVGKSNLEPVDVICGGFPCQDLSVAGKRAGLAGERSGLWHEFHRIVAETKPSWVIIENVPGLLSSNGGRDFAVVLRGLVKCGYGVAYRILDARYFGVAQRRRRVFIVASIGSGRCAQVLFESEGVSRDIETCGETREIFAFSAGQGSKAGSIGASNRTFPTLKGTASGSNQVPTIAGTLSANRGGLDRPAGNANELDFCIPIIARNTGAGFYSEDDSASVRAQQGGTSFDLIAFNANDNGQDATLELTPTLKHQGDGERAHEAYCKMAIAKQSIGVRRITPIECERLQGFPDQWTSDFADSTRYRMLGNAVAVPCAEWIARRIVALSIA